MKFTKNEKKVLICMHIWNLEDEYFDGHLWKRYGTMSAETDIEVKVLKTIMQILRDTDLVYFTPSIDVDGMPNGSGWFLTSEGETEAGLLYEESGK